MDNPSGQASVVVNIGSIYVSQDEYENALEHHQDDLTTFKKIDDPLRQSKALMNIGLINFSQAKYGAAVKYHQATLAILKKTDNPPGEAKVLLRIGIVCSNRDKKTEDMALREEAGTIFFKIGAADKLRLVEHML